MKSKHVPGIEIVSIDEPIDFWTKVEMARQMSLNDKFMLGLEMFDQACDEISAKIRAHFPDAPDEAIEKILGLLVERSKRG